MELERLLPYDEPWGEATPVLGCYVLLSFENRLVIQSSIRPEVVTEEVTEEQISPSIKSIVSNAPASVIEKLNEAAYP